MEPIQAFEVAQHHLLNAHGIEARRRFIDVPAVGRTHLFEVGDGPALLFIIGGGAPGAMWVPLVAELDGYRRVIVDRPGFGLTEPVPHHRDAMRRLARDFIGGTLDALGLDGVSIIANSMGAWWSIQFALGDPKRIRAMVSIGCPALLLDTGVPLPMRLIGVRGLGDLLVRLQPSGPKGARQTCRMLGDPLGDTAQDDAMAETLAAMMELPGSRHTWVDLIHAFGRIRGRRPEMVITEADLRRLEVPIQFVWGERDPFGSRDVGRRAAEVAPNATFVPVPGGHDPWITDASAVATPARAFLEQHAPAV